MLRVDAWGDERTWSGWVANRVLYYPSINLRLRDTTREIERLERRMQFDAEKLMKEEAQAKTRFKAAAKKNVSRVELQHHARIISNIAARRRMKLTHQQQYQAALKEVENVRALKDQTEQMNRLARICKSINIAIPMHAAANLERDYSKAKMEIQTKAEMMSDILEDEDEESENKEHDADVIVDHYLQELNVTVSNLPAPGGSLTQPARAGHSVEDEAIMRRVQELDVPR